MNTESPAPMPKLPQLRKGLNITFSDYDLDGKPQWLIYDSGRNKFFVIGWSEYELLKRWDLSDPIKIIDAVNNETKLHVEMTDLESLVKFLKYNYLVQQSGHQIYKDAKSQKLFKDENIFHWLISYYLFFRIPLWHPDKFLTRTKYIGDFLFNRYTAYVMTALGIIAIYQLSLRWEQFIHTFPSVFTLQGLMFYLISFLICKFCHELGHAYMSKRYGAPVPTLGVAFLVFWPVLYTDTTASWSLKSKKRLRIAAAGIWVETYVTIIAALIWCNSSNITIQAICYVTITINWLSSLLINVSPFMRFDGYYILADLVKMPNLQSRAFALTRWQIRRWLFHWEEPPPENFSERMHNFLVAYSIGTWIYRLTLYLGISVLVYHFFIKIVGIILFIIEIYYFILGPIYKELHTWLQLKEQITFNIRTKITIGISLSLLLIFLLPINETIKLPATLSYAHQFLIAPEEGILASDPPAVGTEVKANQPIVIISSPYLEYALKRVELEYQKKSAEFRRSALNGTYALQHSILLSDLNSERAEYSKLLSLKQKLILKVPFNGIVIEVGDEVKKGEAISKDEWIGDVINPNLVQVEAYVSQTDITRIGNGLRGYFYPRNLSQSALPVKVKSIEVINATQLSCTYSTDIKQNKKESQVIETPCYNASEFGGEIATFFSEEGQYVPVDSVYRVLLTVEKPVKFKEILRGTVVLDTESRSYLSKISYKIKKIWIEQSGF
ncbi:MAG TPA: HlyD family efflux transporter periplasmic adaptor subunit [Gammaproteobacteria bacterium]|nr:HlyD family efflux transporter periplasmic adaptor subunit [Gammaproteobacteria bacterium]